jgi:hypothetical protein
MNSRSLLSRITVVLALAAMPFAAFAANIGRASAVGSSIEWQLDVRGHSAVRLTVIAPDGTEYVSTAKGGQNPAFNLSKLGSDLQNGVYHYELVVEPNVPGDVEKKLQAARAAGDSAAAKKIMKAAGLEAITQSGAFTVANGSIVDPNAIESDANDSAVATRNFGVTTNAVRPGDVQTNDQVIPDDLIVQGSICAGFDCVNNESFGFDTIRMKENNTRVKFEDTSVGAFPTNDWQLTANDSASGGASKFSIEDITGAKVPFTITAGASTNSIFVDSTGRVGFRTSTPVLDLHVATSNTPAIRLEQNNAGGFTAQTWDIAGNEANFFVRDVTSGSRLPFRIRPGAPTSSIDISADGDVGVGTASPDEKLHILETVDANTFNLVENSNNSGTSAAAVVRAKADTAIVNFQAHGTARTVSRFGVTLGGWTELLSSAGNGLAMGTSGTLPFILGTNSTNRLHIDTDGDIGINCNTPGSDLVIASGSGCSNPSSSINAGSTQFTVASSRTFKENLRPVTLDNVLDKIDQVGVYEYDFIDGPKDRLGLMAEDFHTIFGRGSEKYIDGQDVQMALWLAVQKLAAENKALTERLAKIEGQVQKQ